MPYALDFRGRWRGSCVGCKVHPKRASSTHFSVTRADAGFKSDEPPSAHPSSVQSSPSSRPSVHLTVCICLPSLQSVQQPVSALASVARSTQSIPLSSLSSLSSLPSYSSAHSPSSLFPYLFPAPVRHHQRWPSFCLVFGSLSLPAPPYDVSLLAAVAARRRFPSIDKIQSFNARFTDSHRLALKRHVAVEQASIRCFRIRLLAIGTLLPLRSF